MKLIFLAIEFFTLVH